MRCPRPRRPPSSTRAYSWWSLLFVLRAQDESSSSEALDQLVLGIGAEAGTLRHVDRTIRHRHGLGIGGEADIGEQALERRRALLGGERVRGRELARAEEERVRDAGDARLLGLGCDAPQVGQAADLDQDRKSTRLNSSHLGSSY